jgi:predicted DNA-binding mobile mystery protein A
MPRVPREVALRGRDLLDEHFNEWQPLRTISRPPHGWIRAVREALGMSAAVLADRLGVTPSAVIRLEQSEAADRVRLETLRRAADALGCDLVYLLVPRRPLSTVVRERASELAHYQVAAVEQTMRLEDQATGDTRELEDRIARRLLERGGLWGTGSSGSPEARAR